MKLVITLLLVSNIVFAGDMIQKKEEINHCLDPITAKQNEEQVRNNTKDIDLIRLVALRTGLCDLVDKKIISVREATDIFELERLKGMTERWKEEVKRSAEHEI